MRSPWGVHGKSSVESIQYLFWNLYRETYFVKVNPPLIANCTTADMRSTLLLALPGLALALVPAPAADGRYTIAADGIKAQFIPYGATLTNLWVKDRHGNDTDVVLGYDDAAYYRKLRDGVPL